MRAPILSLLLALSLHASAGEIDQPTAVQMLQRADTVLIDVRTADEFAEGALPGAVRIETPDIAERIGMLAPEKDTPVVLYCRSGRRSSARGGGGGQAFALPGDAGFLAHCRARGGRADDGVREGAVRRPEARGHPATLRFPA